MAAVAASTDRRRRLVVLISDYGGAGVAVAHFSAWTCTNTIVDPMSGDRRRVPPPRPYPGHRRPHRERRARAPGAGRPGHTTPQLRDGRPSTAASVT